MCVQEQLDSGVVGRVYFAGGPRRIDGGGEEEERKIDDDGGHGLYRASSAIPVLVARHDAELWRG